MLVDGGTQCRGERIAHRLGRGHHDVVSGGVEQPPAGRHPSVEQPGGFEGRFQTGAVPVTEVLAKVHELPQRRTRPAVAYALRAGVRGRGTRLLAGLQPLLLVAEYAQGRAGPLQPTSRIRVRLGEPLVPRGLRVPQRGASRALPVQCPRPAAEVQLVGVGQGQLAQTAYVRAPGPHQLLDRVLDRLVRRRLALGCGVPLALAVAQLAQFRSSLRAGLAGPLGQLEDVGDRPRPPVGELAGGPLRGVDRLLPAGFGSAQGAGLRAVR